MSKKGKNIYARKDGRWEGRYIKGRINGKIQYGYVFGKTYEEVEEKLVSIIGKRAQFGDPSILFSNVSAEWLEHSRPQLKPATVARYTNVLNSYLLSPLGEKTIQEISRRDIQNFANELLISGGVRANGLAPKTVNSILSVAKNIFDYASAEKGCLVADIRNVSVKQPQKQLRILSRYEQQTFSVYLRENMNPCNLGILLSLYSGLRIGEICALKWEDVHFPDRYIYVHQAMQRIQLVGSIGKKTEVRIMEPKSECSIRHIPIPDKMLVLLEDEKGEDDAFVLTGKKDHFIEPRCLENYFKVAVEACGLEDVNYHALRHTFATRCVELGFDIKSLSEILGHSNVNITLNRYVHPSMELKRKNMNMLSEVLTAK